MLRLSIKPENKREAVEMMVGLVGLGVVLRVRLLGRLLVVLLVLLLERLLVLLLVLLLELLLVLLLVLLLLLLPHHRFCVIDHIT